MADGKKRIFVSDIHMNAGLSAQLEAGQHAYEWMGKEEIKVFADFLASVNKRDDVSEFVILGDFMDNWVYPVDEVPPSFDDIIKAKCNASIVKQLKTMCQNKTVVYLPGNHDMGVTQAVLERHFQKMKFGGSALRDSVYNSSRLRAEHGSAHAMFNAPDHVNNPGSRLPLGYFISRVVATGQRNTGRADRHYWSYADDFLEMLGPQTMAQSLFEAMLEEAGLPDDEPIKMPPPARDTNAAEIKQKYARLYDQWAETRGPGAAFKAVLAEIGLLGGLADSLCKRGGTNVVIFGHNHNATLDKDSFFVDERIYANCGTWCEENKPCTYVETEKDDENRKHHVRVMKWEDNQPVQVDEATVRL